MAAHLTAEEAERWIEDFESSLRSAYPEGLPPEWQERLGACVGKDMKSLLSRYFWVRHYYILTQESKADKAAQRETDAQVAARQLLRREPVRVTLAGHDVPITSRSYNAMAEIAAHDLRIRHLAKMLDEVALRWQAASTPLDGPKQEKARARRYATRLEALHRRIYTELMKHRRAMYAHALTPSGAAAQGIEREEGGPDAPAWWREMTPDDDARLLLALLEVGPARYSALGEPPKPKDGKQAKRDEEFGFMSLLATWERTLNLPPAALHDTDLAQLMAWSRAAAPPTLEESLGNG